MAELVVFEILLPDTENATGLVHPQELFDQWVIEAVGLFGGITVLGVGLLGLWYDHELPASANPVEDHNHWYKIAVPPGRVTELRAFVSRTARQFGQKCLYLERSGEAEFVRASP